MTAYRSLAVTSRTSRSPLAHALAKVSLAHIGVVCLWRGAARRGAVLLRESQSPEGLLRGLAIDRVVVSRSFVTPKIVSSQSGRTVRVKSKSNGVD